MKSFFLSFLLVSFPICYAQTKIAPPPDVKPPRPEKPPRPVFEFISYPEAKFPGGAIALKKYILDNFPVERIKVDELENPVFRVYVSFIVCANGTITEVEIARGVNASIDALCMEFIQCMPNWIPGEDRHGPTDSRVRLPINFSF